MRKWNDVKRQKKNKLKKKTDRAPRGSLGLPSGLLTILTIRSSSHMRGGGERQEEGSGGTREDEIKHIQ